MHFHSNHSINFYSFITCQLVCGFGLFCCGCLDGFGVKIEERVPVQGGGFFACGWGYDFY